MDKKDKFCSGQEFDTVDYTDHQFKSKRDDFENPFTDKF